MNEDGYLGTAESADLLQIGRTNFCHLRAKAEGVDPEFPLPIARLACGPVWLHSDMHRYAVARARRAGRTLVRINRPDGTPAFWKLPSR